MIAEPQITEGDTSTPQEENPNDTSGPPAPTHLDYVRTELRYLLTQDMLYRKKIQEAKTNAKKNLYRKKLKKNEVKAKRVLMYLEKLQGRGRTRNEFLDEQGRAGKES